MPPPQGQGFKFIFFHKDHLGSSTIFTDQNGLQCDCEGSFNFTQTTASKFFSQEGNFAGYTIGDVSQMLRSGELTPADVPVEFIAKDGNRLIVNTRSSLALKRAGIPESQWNLINKTGNVAVDNHIANRLMKNKLTTSGTHTLRITGSGLPKSSSLD